MKGLTLAPQRVSTLLQDKPKGRIQLNMGIGAKAFSRERAPDSLEMLLEAASVREKGRLVP